MPVEPQFIKIAEALSGVRGVIIGGVAMAAHGAAHITTDFDLLYERSDDNLRALADALAPFRPRLRGAPEDLPFRWDWRTLKAGLNFTLECDLGDLDLLGYASGAPPFAELARAAAVVQLGTSTASIASLDDLIAMKRAANRPKDRLHLLELEALKRLAEGSPGS